MLGLDYQMVWWPDAFCERLVEAGYRVARYDNRYTGSYGRSEGGRQR
ncbi:hypothetical protein [Micromonospora zhanjiangensis]|uniref:Uncharacterized protein n=1 Tax=Micromonospora zhanjiangensis TaxID=1522057 RepID=A0ABV8KR95_9ACTN